MNDYYNSLNKVMDEIERDLTNKIDYKKLAKIIGTSDYTLQRIFCFLTGITLTEYIRKRRLANAAEDLQLGDEKIIDIALKYQYDSPVSFSRAFKKMHNIKPSEIRQKKMVVKAFPKIEFKPTKKVTEELEYRIMKLDEQIFYGKSTKIIKDKDSKTIAKLWNECKNDGTLDYIITNAKNKEKYYGATEHITYDKINVNENDIKYYIIGKEKRSDFSELVIPKAIWAIFKVKSKEQKDILELINTIYMKWLPSSKYNIILPYPNLEIYYDDYCEYCVPVKHAQLF